MRIVCVIVLLLSGWSLQAQKYLKSARDSVWVEKIRIDSAGIKAVSRNVNDTIVTDVQTGAVLYKYPDGHESFWYVMKVETEAQITFRILPEGKEDLYNFFLYKVDREYTPEEIRQKGIAPFRANLCKNEMSKDGTGISIASSINFYDASSKTIIKDFYYTQYHAPVLAKKGDILILNVYHIKGKDCGYTFDLQAGAFKKQFKTYYRSCFRANTEMLSLRRTVAPEFAINAPEIAVRKEKNAAVTTVPKVIFQVRDSARRQALTAEVTWARKKTSGPMPVAKEKGVFELNLQPGTGYHLVFTSMGYKPREVFFMTGNDPASFTNEVYLTPVRAGENFTMDKIYFYPNTYTMKPGSHGELDKLAVFLLANPEVNIEIQGHTNGDNRIRGKGDDFRGSSKKLSQFRADVIRKYLVAKGVQAERLTAMGYGGSRMIFEDPKTQSQADKNIRVEVMILPPKGTDVSLR